MMINRKINYIFIIISHLIGLGIYVGYFIFVHPDINVPISWFPNVDITLALLGFVLIFIGYYVVMGVSIITALSRFIVILSSREERIKLDLICLLIAISSILYRIAMLIIAKVI